MKTLLNHIHQLQTNSNAQDEGNQDPSEDQHPLDVKDIDENTPLHLGNFFHIINMTLIPYLVNIFI